MILLANVVSMMKVCKMSHTSKEMKPIIQNTLNWKVIREHSNKCNIPLSENYNKNGIPLIYIINENTLGPIALLCSPFK